MNVNHATKRLIRMRSGGVILMLVMACLVAGAGQCFAYWLPWASEGDKIKKTLRDIWQALLNEDKRTARQYLDGNAADYFIQQELDLIKQLGITKVDFQLGEVTLAQAGASFAYVKFDKITTLKDGNEMKTPSLGVFRKAGGPRGSWLYITGLGVPPKKQEEPVDPLSLLKAMTGQKQGTAPAAGGAEKQPTQ